MKKYLFLFLANIFVVSSISHAKNVKHSTGLTFDDKKYEKTLLSMPLLRGQYSEVPSDYSLKKYAPTPKSQGAYGTCVGWSTAYAARTILYSMKNNITNPDLSSQAAFSPSYIYNQLSTDTTCQVGTYLDDALTLLTNQGVSKLSDFSYQCNKPVTFLDQQIAADYKIEGFKKLFDIDDINKVDPIRKSLSENKPVVIGMTCCTESFDNSYGTDLWNPLSTEPMPNFGHAMSVIAYDDNKYGGAFQVINSWGEDWGNKGFIWIKYSDFSKYTEYAFELIDKDKSEILSGELEFKTSDGQKMPTKFKNGIYEVTKPYYSGNLFRLYVSNNEPAYIYAIGSDSTNTTLKVFPHKTNISPYLGYKNSKFALPDENSYIRMDNNKGYDYFCFLYSKTEIDINDLMQKIDSETGSFENKLAKALPSQILPLKDITYSDNNKISFSAKAGTQSIIPVIIKMEHR